MKAEIIFKDEAQIELLKRKNEKYVRLYNEAIEAVRATGVVLDDNMLPMFINNPSRVLQEADKQVRAEQDKASRFKFFSKNVDTTPITEEIKGILENLEKTLHKSYEFFNPVFIEFKDGKACLVSNFDEQMEDLYSIKLDTPEKVKAWRLAGEIKAKIDELEDFLAEHGDGVVHSLCKDKGPLYNNCIVLMDGGFSPTYRARLYPDIMKRIK